MAKDGTYADQLTLVAACKVLKVTLKVVQGGGTPDVTMGDCSSQGNLIVGYLVDQQHYVSLKSSTGTPK